MRTSLIHPIKRLARLCSGASLVVMALACEGQLGAPTGARVDESHSEVKSSKRSLEIDADTSWQAVASESYLSFISVKQTDIAEVHTFERFDARVTRDGTAVVTIDLSSLATGSELRDQRLRDYLFEVDAYPQAQVDLHLDMLPIAQIEVGTEKLVTANATITLHGLSASVATDLILMRIAEDKLLASPVKPIVLHAADFNLTAGIQYLIELAGLQSISSAVPVDFMFTFQAMPVTK